MKKFGLKRIAAFAAVGIMALSLPANANAPIRTSIILPPAMNQHPVMRVAILQNVDKARLEFSSPYTVKHPITGDLLAQGLPQKEIIVNTSEDGILLDGRLIRTPHFTVITEDEMVQIEGRTYRAALRVQKNEKGKLLLVNEIAIDEYLKGVLPGEVDPRWHMEALKAQAVAARTFALFQALKNPEAPFFLTNDVKSQVYTGKNSEHIRTSEAVDATRGQVLTYRGMLFTGYFHSSCGGRTTSADAVWHAIPIVPLSGVTCGFCAGNKYDSWKSEFTFEEIRKKLNDRGYKFGTIKRIDELDHDRSGRIKRVAIHHSAGTRNMPASDFRLFIGADKMRSTLAKFQNSGGKLLITGKGWGHGVGMCQWGSKTMAERSFQYDNILRFYYPGSQISQAYSSPIEKPSGNWFSRSIDTIKGWFGA